MLRARIEVWNDETNENIAVNAQGADASEIGDDAGHKFHVALANLNVLPVTVDVPAVDPALELDPEAPK